MEVRDGAECLPEVADHTDAEELLAAGLCQFESRRAAGPAYALEREE
jgi:hypothetical protein